MLLQLQRFIGGYAVTLAAILAMWLSVFCPHCLAHAGTATTAKTGMRHGIVGAELTGTMPGGGCIASHCFVNGRFRPAGNIVASVSSTQGSVLPSRAGFAVTNAVSLMPPTAGIGQPDAALLHPLQRSCVLLN